MGSLRFGNKKFVPPINSFEAKTSWFSVEVMVGQWIGSDVDMITCGKWEKFSIWVAGQAKCIHR